MAIDTSVCPDSVRALGAAAKHPPHFSPKAAVTAFTHSPSYVWYVIALLFVVNICNYMDRMALAVLLPAIKADLELSDGQVGLLMGLAFSLFYAVCGIPIARWADRGVRRDIIAIALVIWSLMTALSGAVQNFWHLFVTRMGVGIGEAGCLPPSQSMICDYVPLRRRSGVFAIHSFGLIAGMMLGMVLAGPLVEMIGWRWTFVALGLPGVALAIVVKITLREPARGTLELVRDDDDREPSIAETMKVLWRCRTYRLLAIFLAVNGFIQYGLNQWWPSFYGRSFGLGMSTIGMHLGLAIGVGSGVGLLIGGWLANRSSQRDVRWTLLTGAVATAMTLPVAIGSLLISNATVSILLLSATVLLWSVPNGSVIAALYSVVQPKMRAMAGAITIFSTSVLGFGLGPMCVGVVSDVLTPSLGSEALRYALLGAAALLPVLPVALYAAARHLPVDLRMMGTKVEV